MSNELSLSAKPLAKGDACLTCRAHKVKCDGEKPLCGRCRRLHKTCEFPGGVARRRRVTDILEARADDLQLQVLALCSKHDRIILSQRLFDKLKLLSHLDPGKHSYTYLPMFPWNEVARQSAHTHRISGEISNEDTEEGYKPVIQRSIVERVFDPQDVDYTNITPEVSHYLIGLFLPYRSQFQFFMDVSRFLDLLALPPTDPESIHPCLLHACYLVACCLTGGSFAALEPVFVERTRHYLQQSLAFADRLTHFLWASIILGSYFARVRRLQESYAVISSAARFALACGLDGSEPGPLDVNSPDSPLSDSGYFGNDSDNNRFLLGPPKDHAEALERVRLAHSIYLTDRSLAMLSGYPSAFVFNEGWAETLATQSTRMLETQGANSSEELSSNSAAELKELSASDVPLKIKSMILYERVEKLCFRVAADGLIDAYRREYLLLKHQLNVYHASLPPFSDTRGIKAFEAVSVFNPHILLAHTTHHGSALLLHGLMTGEDLEAKAMVFESAKALADICSRVRGARGIRRVQGFLVPVLHMMNASRVFARELKNPQTRQNSHRLAECCDALALLVDFIHDVTGLYPAWANVQTSLRALLPASPNALIEEVG